MNIVLVFVLLKLIGTLITIRHFDEVCNEISDATLFRVGFYKMVVIDPFLTTCGWLLQLCNTGVFISRERPTSTAVAVSYKEVKPRSKIDFKPKEIKIVFFVDQIGLASDKKIFQENLGSEETSRSRRIISAPVIPFRLPVFYSNSTKTSRSLKGSKEVFEPKPTCGCILFKFRNANGGKSLTELRFDEKQEPPNLQNAFIISENILENESSTFGFLWNRIALPSLSIRYGIIALLVAVMLLLLAKVKTICLLLSCLNKYVEGRWRVAMKRRRRVVYLSIRSKEPPNSKRTGQSLAYYFNVNR